LGLAEPTEAEFNKVIGDFGFHPLAIEDALTAHQRPKYEEFPKVQVMVVKTVFYEDRGSQISTGEIFIFIGENFVVVVRHGNGAPLVNTRQQLENNPEHISKGPIRCCACNSGSCN
jgi:magnesium transporter